MTAAKILALAGLLVAVVYGLRLLEILRDPDRRPWANSTDPTFQGDGWRWTLSLLLPDLAVLGQGPDGYPLTVKLWPLTDRQWLACRAEWQTAQAHYAFLAQQAEAEEGVP